MKNKILILSLLFIAWVAPSLRAQTDLTAVERKIELGLYRGDAALVAEAEAAVAAGLKAEPKAPAWLYLQGFATYARGCLGYKAKDMKAVRSGLELAEKQLQAVKGSPWQAEAQALRGYIFGQLIGVRGGAAMMTLGPKVGELTGAAYETLPESARVKLFRGVSNLNTPAMFGGDKQEAGRLFMSAGSQFEQAKPKDGALRWGQALALGWLAQARQQTGDMAGAREAAEAALKLEPEYHWARGILKSIEKDAAKKR
jgi:tetratricopeptide (TPR) repeat protein